LGVIAFQSDAQQAVYGKVLGWMRELYPAGEIRVREHAPVIGLIRGSAYIEVSIWPWGKDEATIQTRSWVVQNAPITPALMKYLLEENYLMRFGAFGLDDEGAIFLQHTIVGSTCDREELTASVLSVGAQADHYDDIIVARWGGNRAVTPGK
jgi:hypothetical protein